MIKYVLIFWWKGDSSANFLLRFHADVQYGTFIFDRREEGLGDEVQLLKTLSSLNLLEVDTQLAKVRTEYLGFFNEFLKQIREVTVVKYPETEAERQKIGNIAEAYAEEFERQRLSKLGYDELKPLIQRISAIDRSAGYDLISFRGSSLYPEENIFIEVKGTKLPYVVFNWSSNERRVANLQKKKYWIYAFTNVNVQEETAQGPIRINDPIRTLGAKGYTVEPLAVRVSKRRKSIEDNRKAK